MNRNVYFALAVVMILALFTGIEWLFLFVVLLFVALFLADRLSGAAPFSSQAEQQKFQQPVVIQATQSSGAQAFYTELVNNVIQSTLEDKKFKELGDKLGKHHK